MDLNFFSFVISIFCLIVSLFSFFILFFISIFLVRLRNSLKSLEIKKQKDNLLSDITWDSKYEDELNRAYQIITSQKDDRLQ